MRPGRQIDLGVNRSVGRRGRIEPLVLGSPQRIWFYVRLSLRPYPEQARIKPDMIPDNIALQRLQRILARELLYVMQGAVSNQGAHERRINTRKRQRIECPSCDARERRVHGRET